MIFSCEWLFFAIHNREQSRDKANTAYLSMQKMFLVKM